MRQVVFLGVFFITLFTTLFCLLPIGLGAVNENGAPANPRILLKLLISIAAAVVLTGIFYGLTATGVINI